jgi:hypothetical protein
MSAPSGNQFWKLRSKHGRDLIFSSPTVLWEACVEYFEATDARKWIRKDWVGKDAKEVQRETDAPYTLSGLYVFLDIDRKTWDLYRQREDFIPIITRVEQIMFTQKFEGASVGAFNASIIARDLGLKDASEVNITADRKAVSDLFPEELEGNGQDYKPQP